MIITNAHRETAIVIRRDGRTAVFVKFASGKLSCDRLTEARFRDQWQEMRYPLAEALERFLEHARMHGATQEAIKGLEKLKARDMNALSNLF